METFVTLVLHALSGTSIVVMLSVGLFIVFGMMGVINLAHGEFFMLGAYAAALIGGSLGNPWVGIVSAPIVVCVFGLVVERVIIRPLYRRPLETLLSTWGLSIVVRQTVRVLFGAGHRVVRHPLPGEMCILGVDYPILRVFIIVVSVVVLAALYLGMFKTDLGLRVRAVIANRDMAEAVGIDSVLTGQVAFGLGSALAGLAGAIMSPLVPINPEMGVEYVNKAFLAVIVGGFDRLIGVLGGGAVIGGGESLLSLFVRPLTAQVLILIATVMAIRFKPRGLFGRK